MTKPEELLLTFETETQLARENIFNGTFTASDARQAVEHIRKANSAIMELSNLLNGHQPPQQG